MRIFRSRALLLSVLLLSSCASRQVQTGTSPTSDGGRQASTPPAHSIEPRVHIRELEKQLEGLERQPKAESQRAALLRAIGDAYAELGESTLAVRCYTRSLELYRKVPGSEAEQANSLVLIGFVRADADDAQTALTCFRNALRLYPDIRENWRKIAITHSAIAQALGKVGSIPLAVDEFAVSIRYYERFGNGAADIAAVTAASGALRVKSGNPQEGLRELLKASGMYAQIPGAQIQQATVLRGAAQVQEDLGDLRGARSTCEDVLRLYGHDPATWLEQAEAMERSGRISIRLNEPGAAKIVLNNALDLYRSHARPEDQRTCAEIAVLMGYVLGELGEYDSAARQYEYALGYYRAHPDRKAEIGHICGNYGFDLSKLGKLDEALAQYDVGVAAYKSLGGHELDVADLLIRIGSIDNVLGRYGDSADRLSEAKGLYDGTLKPSKHERAILLINLANAYRGGARYGPALAWDEEAIRLLTGVRDAQRDLARAYRGSGLTLAALGRSTAAIERYDRAVQLLTPFSDTEVDRAQLLNNIANAIGARDGPSVDSVKRYEQALAALANPDRFRRDRAIILNNLGKLLDDLGRPIDAARRFREGLELIRGRHVGGPIEPVLYNNLGVSLDRPPTQEQAYNAFKTAVELYHGMQGFDALRAQALVNLGESLAKRGDSRSAASRCFEGLSLAWTFLIGNGSILDTAEKREFFGENVPSADVIYQSTLRADANNAELGLEAALLRKAIRFELSRHEQRVFLDRGSPQAIRLLQRLIELKREAATVSIRLNQLEAQGTDPGYSRPTGAAARLSELQQEIKQTEAMLRQEDIAFDAQMRLQRTQLSEVKASLRPDEAFLEFVEFASGPGSDQGDHHYGVYLLDGASGHVRGRDLGTVQDIDQVIKAFRDRARFDMGNPLQVESRVADETPLARRSSRLRQLIFDPLMRGRGRLPRRVYIAPEGPIAMIPFEALATERKSDGWKYLGEEVEFVYLTSGRDLVRRSIKKVSPIAAVESTAVLVGDPDYDADNDALIRSIKRELESSAAASNNPARPESTLSSTIVRNAAQTPPTLVGAGRRWEPIPSTGEFVRRVAERLRDRGVRTSVLTGDGAVEEAILFRRCPNILQFATHGIFLPRRPVRRDASIADNPLLRSMLILAGANNQEPRPVLYRGGQRVLTEAELNAAGHKRSDAEAQAVEIGSGYLTAFEISGMDLRCTDLVCLAACESGLGEPEAGEGMVGLRQAFLEAGASSVIMSLWPVPSDETLAQMNDFYDRWLRGGETRYSAFHDAQIASLARARRDRNSGHPFWWAGFVYVGRPGDNVAATQPGRMNHPRQTPP